jgi:hypothetical protein
MGEPLELGVEEPITDKPIESTEPATNLKEEIENDSNTEESKSDSDLDIEQ